MVKLPPIRGTINDCSTVSFISPLIKKKNYKVATPKY